MELSDLVYIDDTGYHYADYPTFLEWQKEKYRGIYGADVYLEDDSQDGQFLAIQAKALYDTAALGASIYNSFSPVTAQGTGLARVVKINGLTKLSASKSTAELDLVGVEGTVINNGIATDTLGQKWFLPTPTTIPPGGAITVTAEAEFDGATTALPDTIATIFTPTLGWQTVNNPDAATPGAPVESDAELRVRQSQSTANPSLTVFDGTKGAVANIPGVTKSQGYENDTNDPDDSGVPPHSISMVVAGGDDTAIAQAIQVHKTPGTGTYGDTSDLVYDAHGMPIIISFQRAVTATIGVEITISAGIGWSSDYEALIKAAVAEVINAVKIGNSVLITKLFAPAYLFGSIPGGTYDIVTLELNMDGGSFSPANVDLDWDQNPVCDPDTDVAVIVT